MRQGMKNTKYSTYYVPDAQPLATSFSEDASADARSTWSLPKLLPNAVVTGIPGRAECGLAHLMSRIVRRKRTA